MRSFSCTSCGALVFFENSVCVTCGSALGYYRLGATMVALTDGRYTAPDGVVLRPCANLDVAACNWLRQDGWELCPCCELTRTRPADFDADGMAAFARTEVAKRRLLFQLDALGLPTTPRAVDPAYGLAFDLLSSADGPITTGHEDGVITIDLAEGDDSHREAMRERLDEPYRTLLGHLRHEIGHWYWAVLVTDRDAFRAVFGDERADYQGALASHYNGANGAWRDRYVSAYAAAHPWEDWAETFAHYLHITDTLETAAAFGLLSAVPADFDAIIEAWLPLSLALNAVNRSMGKDDLYPFVLPPVVLEKLRFVHALVRPLGGRHGEEVA